MSEEEEDRDLDRVLVFFYIAGGGESVVQFAEEHMLIREEAIEYIDLTFKDKTKKVTFDNQRYNITTELARWLWDTLQGYGFELLDDEVV